MFLLGADRLGRDMLSRIVYGARASLSIGLVGVTFSLVLGILFGGLSGYYGGRVDWFVQRVIEFILSLPTIPIWLALAAALPKNWSPLTTYFCITLIISLIGWTELARVVRGRFLALRSETFVTAAWLDGCSQGRIIFRHMLPSLTSHIIASVTLAIPLMILAETSLELPRPRAAAAGDQLGRAAEGGAGREVGLVRAVAAAAGRGGGDHRAGAQLPRRRAARRGRSPCSLNAEPGRRDRARRARAARRISRSRQTELRAVDDVSFTLERGRTLCIVGESGSGKSMTARSILQIVGAPGRIVGGEVLYTRRPGDAPVDLAKLPAARAGGCARVRGREIAMVFQEPMTSLSPIHQIGWQIAEALLAHRHDGPARGACSARSSCCARWRSRRRRRRWIAIRSSSAAACGSAR